ncbi:hypothetical protein SLA2020_267380 [Shorea laevis]
MKGTIGGRSHNGDKFFKSFEDDDDDDYNSDLGRSDILESPIPSDPDEDDGVTSAPSFEFHAAELKNPVLRLR